MLRMIRKARISQWLLEGEERKSKKNMSILFLGGGAEKTYLAELAFSGGYSETLIGKEWMWNLRRATKQNSADIVVVTNAGPRLHQYLSDGNVFYIPNWVKGEIVFSDALARMKTSGHLKSDLRRIRKNGFEFELTHSPSRYDDFFNTMYVPYISKAYGRTAQLMSYERMKEYEGRSELMLVTRNGEPLAGQILVYENDRVRCWSIGVKDGNHEYVKMGAQAALYWYEIQYLSDRGYKVMHVGSSRAFLNDGVLRFKNKWGMRMLNPSPKGFMLKPLRKSEGAMSFLVNNPFIHIDSDKYVGIVFANDSQSTNNGRDIYAPYCSLGLASLKVYTDIGLEQNSVVQDGREDGISIVATETLI